MNGLLQRVLKRKSKPISYEDSTRLSSSADAGDRRRAAKHGGIKPEFLYLLAQDADPTVRAAVALNEATPVQADLILARDKNAAVRGELAQKIARLAPGLTPNEQDRVRRMTYEVLEILMQDQIARVREILAETLKSMPDAPAEIVQRLARDLEIKIAGPILEFSPILTDADLLEIIEGNPIAGARAAVARRHRIQENVSDAIGQSDDIDAITALLSNPSAQIREETLNRLIERAPGVVAWHSPLVRRPRLPLTAVKRLAEFVASNLLTVLSTRADLDPTVAQEIAEVAATRLAEAAETDQPHEEDPLKAAVRRARRLHAEGKLDDESLGDAITARDRHFVRASLAIRAGLPVAAVDRVLGAHSAKGLVSLAWKAGLKPAMTIRIQTDFAHIKWAAVVRMMPNGSFPMTAEAMRWHLEFLTGIAETAA